MAYWLAYGPFDLTLHVLHGCDNPPCVRPDHLRLGTPLDNARDASERGRRPLGEDHPQARLTDDAVRAIRLRYAAGATLTALSRAHGVGWRAIRSVVRRETWRHVE